jgi:lipoate---protein ligase
MQFLDLTLPTPAENLALDEALLDVAEASDTGAEILRVWEPTESMVVMGRSSQAEVEVQLEACERRNVPVLRRSSGGATIVSGPGCLMYGVVLSYDRRPELRSLDEAHRFVLETILAGLRPLVPEVSRQGTCDLVVGLKKFSGNAVRCKRSNFLYHGTLLYDFPLELVSELLGTPPRQPGYRAGRPHDSFVMNLPLSGSQLCDALKQAWGVTESDALWPRDRVEQLAAEKYSRREWTFRLG